MVFHHHVASHAEHERLGQAVGDAVHQARDNAQRTADAEAHGDEAHVLARAVGQLALDVALPVHLEGRVAHREHAQNHHDQLGEARPHIGRGENVEPQHDEQRALQQHAGQQGRHGARRLGMGVGQPGVHGKQARLGAEADGGEHEGDHRERVVERGSHGQDGRPEHRLMRVGHHVGGVRVHEQRAEQTEGHAGRADDDVLPRRLQGKLGAVHPHEEHRGQGGGLHRHPHHDDVVGGDGQNHREHEQTEEHVVLFHLGGPELPIGHIVGHIGQRVQARGRRDNGNEAQEQRPQPVQMEPAAQGEEVAAGEHRGHEPKPRYSHDGQGQDVNGLEQAAGRGLRGQQGHGGGRNHRAAQQAD